EDHYSVQGRRPGDGAARAGEVGRDGEAAGEFRLHPGGQDTDGPAGSGLRSGPSASASARCRAAAPVAGERHTGLNPISSRITTPISRVRMNAVPCGFHIWTEEAEAPI